jgi:type 1 glutamine amidotransferase
LSRRALRWFALGAVLAGWVGLPPAPVRGEDGDPVVRNPTGKSQQESDTPRAADRLKALIVDGQNNHGNWPETTVMMQTYLRRTDRFDVDVARTAAEGTDPAFRPRFQDYDVVISNYNGAAWPEATQKEFVDYIAGGGGLVVVHAADNAFPDWPEYNRMIGVGGWGDRNESNGPYLFVDDNGDVVRDPSPGPGGGHGPQREFAITVRDPAHPITAGMPPVWMHANDELYEHLRGPAENVEILATAWSDPELGGTGRHEPMLMAIHFGQGRVFHLTLGHGNDSQECVGFIASLVRGAEWVATGEVTIPLPDPFPTETQSLSVPFDEAGGAPDQATTSQRGEVRTAIAAAPARSGDDDRPLVVFITGDQEYRSEESMPYLARMLADRHDCATNVCYSLADDGTIDPDNVQSVSGIEALDRADLVVLFTRYRDWPDQDFRHFEEYIGRGGPIVGFRTATHAFQFSRPELADWNNVRLAELFGQTWVTHHGHFDDTAVLTRVELAQDRDGRVVEHPILRGVEPFDAASWLYHVQGGGNVLHGDDVTVLLTGTSLRSSHAQETDRFPLTQPVAWTKTHVGKDGTVGRVFFTTLGHPADFDSPAMRRLAIHGILWALGKEDSIPPEGADVRVAEPLALTPAGFGGFKKGVRPADQE